MQKHFKKDPKLVKEVVERMVEDAQRRKIGFDKKCKIEHVENYYTNLSTRGTKTENDQEGNVKNFKEKGKHTHNSKNYNFNVNLC